MNFIIILSLIVLFSILAGFTLEKSQDLNYKKQSKDLELLKKKTKLRKQKIREILKSKIDEKHITDDIINFISFMSKKNETDETDENINYTEKYIKLLMEKQPEIFI